MAEHVSVLREVGVETLADVRYLDEVAGPPPPIADVRYLDEVAGPRLLRV